MPTQTRLRDPARASIWATSGLAFLGIGATMTFPHPSLSPDGTVAIATAAFLAAAYCLVRAFRYGLSGVTTSTGVSYPQFMQTREQLRNEIASQRTEIAELKTRNSELVAATSGRHLPQETKDAIAANVSAAIAEYMQSWGDEWPTETDGSKERFCIAVASIGSDREVIVYRNDIADSFAHTFAIQY